MELRQLRHHGDVGTGGVTRGEAAVVECVGGEGDGSHAAAIGVKGRDLGNDGDGVGLEEGGGWVEWSGFLGWLW